MRTILINSYARTITETEVPENVGEWLTEVYRQLSTNMPQGKCDMIELGWRIPRADRKEDALYVDEEGLMKPCDSFFYYDGAHQPFAGSGLICGHNPSTGKACAAAADLQAVIGKVRFMNRIEAHRLAVEKGA